MTDSRVARSEELSSAPSTASPRRGSFASDLLKLVSGTAFAQVVTVLATPILTRLFAPEAFGVGVAFSSILSVILVFLSLRYEQAIVLPVEDEQAANVAAVSLLAMAVITTASSIFFWLWGETFLDWLSMPELAPYLWMLGPGLLAFGLLQIFNSWNTRSRHFGQVATAQMINAFTTVGSRVASGLAGQATSGAMIATNIFGTACAVGQLGFLTIRRSGALFRRAVRPSAMAAVARRYSDLPIYGTWSSLLNSISWQLPVFMLTAFFAPAVAGQYALGNRIVKLPMSLVGDAIGKVFYQRAAESKHAGSLAALTEATYRRLVTFGLPPMLFLAVAGRDLFALVFGAQWADAGIYMQILAVWAFFWFITSPIGTLYLVLDKQRFFFAWNAANFATRFASLWIGGMMGSPLVALGLFGASGILVYGYLNLYLLHAAGVPPARTLSILGLYTLHFLPIAATMLLLKLIGAPLWLEVGLPGMMVAGYLLYAFRSEPRVQAMLGRFLRRR